MCRFERVLIMANSPFRSVSEDKNIMYSGMFLRPHIAESLKVLICNKVVQERAQFTVAKSQVHPNGLCEIVVKKQDPNVSTSSIMELLKQCRDLVQEHGYDSGGGKDDLNRTIDLTCDDSICIVSPTAFNGRTVTMKRTISSPSDRREPVLQNTAPASTSHGRSSEESKPFSLQSTDPSRKVSFKRNVADTTLKTSSQCEQSSNLCSLEPVSKRPNIVVQVSNNLHSLLTSKGNEDKQSNAPKFFEDVLPSAPVWTSTEPSKFSLSIISKHLGAKDIGQDHKPPSNSVALNNSDDEVQDQLSISQISKDASKTLNSLPSNNNPSENELALRPSVSDTSFERSIDQSVEILGEIEEIGSSKSYDDLSIRLKDGKNDEKCGAVMCQSTEGHNSRQVSEVAQNKEVFPGNSSTSHADWRAVSKEQGKNESQEKVNVGALGYGGAITNDDEIIIEKEVLSDTKTLSHTLIIDDSDDDIAVCEVVSSTSSSKVSLLKENLKLKLSKRQRKKMKLSQSQVKIPAGSNFTASTTSGSAPDFIPLNPHYRRIDPKISHCRGNTDKMAKQLKLQGKKLKKAKAQIQEQRRRDATSSQNEKTPQEVPSKERNEFNGNVINPNSGEVKSGLRPIVIDASNVAVGHGRGSFSVPGLKICIKYFTDRGHKVHAFAPKYRRFHVSPEDRKTMDDLENEGVLSFTPSRTMPDGRKVASYDDRFIVQTAAELGGVVVSTDNFRDLLSENEAWRETIEQRLLMFTWVGDMLLFPNDPLGRLGPHLNEFLRFPDPPSQH